MGEILQMEEDAHEQQMQLEVEAQEQLQNRIQRRAQYVSDTTGWWDLVDTARYAAEAIDIEAAEAARTVEETLLVAAIVPPRAGPPSDLTRPLTDQDAEEKAEEEEEEVEVEVETVAASDSKSGTALAGAWQAGASGERSGELWSEDVFDSLLLFLDVTSIGHCFFVCSYWASAAGAVNTDNRLWEQLCKRIYTGMLGRVGRVSEYLTLGDTRARRVLQRTKKYPMWKQMFVNRPRVRANGVYVLRFSSIKRPVRDMWTTLEADDFILEVCYYRCYCFDENGTVRYATLYTKATADCVRRFQFPDQASGTSLAANTGISHGNYSVNAKGEVRMTVQLPHVVVNFGLKLDKETRGLWDTMELHEHWSLCNNDRTQHSIKAGETTTIAQFYPYIEGSGQHQHQHL
jgi:hypothetical protein